MPLYSARDTDSQDNVQLGSSVRDLEHRLTNQPKSGPQRLADAYIPSQIRRAASHRPRRPAERRAAAAGAATAGAASGASRRCFFCGALPAARGAACAPARGPFTRRGLGLCSLSIIPLFILIFERFLVLFFMPGEGLSLEEV